MAKTTRNPPVARSTRGHATQFTTICREALEGLSIVIEQRLAELELTSVKFFLLCRALETAFKGWLAAKCA